MRCGTHTQLSTWQWTHECLLTRISIRGEKGYLYYSPVMPIQLRETYVRRTGPHPQAPPRSLGPAGALCPTRISKALPSCASLPCENMWLWLMLGLLQPLFPQTLIETDLENLENSSTCVHAHVHKRDTRTCSLMKIKPEGLPCPWVAVQNLCDRTCFPAWVQQEETWDWNPGPQPVCRAGGQWLNLCLTLPATMSLGLCHPIWQCRGKHPENEGVPHTEVPCPAQDLVRHPNFSLKIFFRGKITQIFKKKIKENPTGCPIKYFHFKVFTPKPCPIQHYNLLSIIHKTNSMYWLLLSSKHCARHCRVGHEQPQQASLYSCSNGEESQRTNKSNRLGSGEGFKKQSEVKEELFYIKWAVKTSGKGTVEHTPE